MTFPEKTPTKRSARSRTAKVSTSPRSPVETDELNPVGPGEAIANYDSVTDGQKIVDQALKKWGRVDILINNAGILRDKSFKGMSDAEFDIIQAVSLVIPVRSKASSLRRAIGARQGIVRMRKGLLASLPKAKVWPNRQHGFGSWTLRKFRTGKLLCCEDGDGLLLQDVGTRRCKVQHSRKCDCPHRSQPNDRYYHAS